MPRDLQTFTNCAGPGVATSHENIGGIVGFFLRIWYSTPVLGPTFAIATLMAWITVTVVTTIVTIPGVPGLAAAVAWIVVIASALEQVKYWYYNERLLCVSDEDECVIGTVLSEPVAAFDGDRKLNLLVAPFIRDECIEMLVVHLDANRDLLTASPLLPDFPPLSIVDPLSSKLDRLQRYMNALADAAPQLFAQVIIGFVDRLMSDDNESTFFQEPKNFYNRFYRKDPAFIVEGSPLWDAIPQDYDPNVPWDEANARSDQPLNPMVRFHFTNLTPYLHCEIEGNRFALIIDEILNTLMAFFALLLLLIALSAALPWLGALILAIAFFFLNRTFDDAFKNDGLPEYPDVGWDDLDESLDQDGDPGRPGDLIVLRGRWIMDTEHEQYFEIHPVRAYYLVARNDLDEPEAVEPAGGESFDPRLISRARAESICGMVQDSEDEDRPGSVEITLSEALSYGLQTPYSGGGLIAR